MYVRQLTYSIDLDQGETFTMVQQHLASLYRRYGLVRFLLLADPEAPERITEFQVFYDEDAWRDAFAGIKEDPFYPNLTETLDTVTGGTRRDDQSRVHSLILDVGGAARG
ncbi:hypothetical protein [Fodinicurvata sp. EGI_FJ10296]|uniref:hypothetical protein n=1 Tax=Fodinicurvata sp. EGI_FJ10296 TaxID=3231908 RepID=UPI003451E314